MGSPSSPPLLPLNPEHRPKLADELGEQVPKLHAEVPPHVVRELPNGFHLVGRAPRFWGRPPPCLPSHYGTDQVHRTHKAQLRGEGQSSPATPWSNRVSTTWAALHLSPKPSFMTIHDHPTKVIALETSESAGHLTCITSLNP